MNSEDYLRMFDEVMRKSLSTSNKTLVIEEDNWLQIITPSEKVGRKNIVLVSNSTRTDHKKIIDTIQSYRERQLPFQWRVTDLSFPHNLYDLLIAEGMQLIFEVDALIRNIGSFEMPLNNDIQVVDVDKDNLKDYVEAACSGWSEIGLKHEEVEADMSRMLNKNNKQYRHFIAYFQAVPAGIGNLELFEHVGSLVSSATCIDQRGKGVYSQLVRHRLKILEENGVGLALIQAKSDTSSPICKKFGFQTVGKIKYLEMK